MANRMDLQAELKLILGNDNVYFQPPETIKLKYPCIIYNFSNAREMHANDESYLVNKSYTITLIHSNPDNDVIDKLVNRKYCRLSTSYTKDNLHHYVFELSKI